MERNSFLSKIINRLIAARFSVGVFLCVVLVGVWLAQFVVLPAQLGRVVGFSLAAADQNLSPFMSYARATVIGLEGLREDEYAGKVVSFQQDVRIRMDDKELVTVFATQPGVLVSKLEVGDEVVVARVGTDPNDYVIVEQYRLPVLWAYIF